VQRTLTLTFLLHLQILFLVLLATLYLVPRSAIKLACKYAGEPFAGQVLGYLEGRAKASKVEFACVLLYN
jgi:hypothetical protein